MKLSLLPVVALAFAGFSPVLVAQQPVSPSAPAVAPFDKPAKQSRPSYVEKLTEALSLTPVQVESVKSILAAQKAAGKALREDTTLTKDERIVKGSKLKGEAMAKIRAVLTPEQATKFDALTAKKSATKSEKAQ